ncbi:MAG: class I SAM-dependent methyltransferase [Candidatus ainarchaeum sp.]|nr:class I SAM-dependent methyltransferase [Candidatus ainarchaeum sp.]
MVKSSDFYSQIALGYNELHAEEQLKKAEFVKSKINLNGLLLDIGAGTCVSTKEFLDKAERIVALDPSKAMLLQCSSQEILRVCAKAEKLPFPDAIFDSVVSLTALHHSDLEIAFAEIMRVAKPNAKIAVSFLKQSKKIVLAKRLFRDFDCFEEAKDLVFAKDFGKAK